MKKLLVIAILTLVILGMTACAFRIGGMSVGRNDYEYSTEYNHEHSYTTAPYSYYDY